MQQKSGLLSQLAEHIATVDVFIGCASFESRCLSVIRHLDPGMVRHACVVVNKDSPGVVERHVRTMMSLFGRAARRIEVDRLNPVVTADALDSCVKEVVQANTRVAVDITTFTHEELLILLRVLGARWASGSELLLLYATAAEYSIGDANENKWLSKGVREIRSVLGYSGAVRPSLSFHLIVLPGIEFERVEELVIQFEPSSVSVGRADRSEHGVTPHLAVHEHQCGLVRELVSDVREFTFAALDPVRTSDALSRECDLHRGRSNIVLAPMNTKLSTIGAALAVRRCPSVQICYASVELYNYDRYSLPGDMFVLLEDAEVLFES